jgi:hypothetical protein
VRHVDARTLSPLVLSFALATGLGSCTSGRSAFFPASYDPDQVMDQVKKHAPDKGSD